MILLSLIGAFEPIVNLGNLKFIVQNLETLTGKQVKFVKHADSDTRIILKGRHVPGNNISLGSDSDLKELSEPGNHRQISTRSMFEVLFKIKSKLTREYFKKRINSDFFLIGITSLDIFPTNDHEYVFGQSDPEKGIAIISAYRLCLTSCENLINSRILKVIMHEYGHLMNLGHCKNTCLMSIISSLDELDNRTLYCCRGCLNQINEKSSASESVKNLLDV